MNFWLKKLSCSLGALWKKLGPLQGMCVIPIGLFVGVAMRYLPDAVPQALGLFSALSVGGFVGLCMAGFNVTVVIGVIGLPLHASLMLAVLSFHELTGYDYVGSTLYALLIYAIACVEGFALGKRKPKLFT